ncbi:MAG: 3-(methylthio)propionyl-CoA ligase, partial [Janthinobacterium lividum]
SLIEFAQRHHGDGEIISRRVEGDLHRSSWGEVASRARQFANVLDGLEIPLAARVASLAWNGYRHLELYFGVSGSGRVLHTINPRMFVEQIAWTINHADDQVVCFDTCFLPIILALHGMCPGVRHWVALCDADALPAAAGSPVLASYEALLATRSSQHAWASFDENTASSMCYTSGTTGQPKAVLYSHRSTILHAYGAALPDVMALSARDAVLPVVPMFHVNAWGIPYSAALTGCKLVFPGPALDGKSLYELLESEQVSFAAGVPTVWQALLAYLQSSGSRFSSLQRTLIGGAACPPAMIAAFGQEYGVEVLHGWGMTETSPLGTVCSLKNKHLALPVAQQNRIREKQGRAIFGLDMKIVDEHGMELPHDGIDVGDLLVRGGWVMQSYYRDDGSAPLVNGWFPTGDVASIDADGYMQITDRSKDMIKSGGEWISSIALENIAMAHPAVAMAACIGVTHPKWHERPILVVVKRAGMELTRELLLASYSGKVAKWQVPDDVVFVDALPLGATGKMMKRLLRETLKAYVLPAVS